MAVTSPPRGPENSEGGGFAAADSPVHHGGAAGPLPGFDKGTLARTLTGLRGQVASLPDRPASLRVLAPCQIPAPLAPPPPPTSTTNQEMIDPVNPRPPLDRRRPPSSQPGPDHNRRKHS